MNSRGLDRFSKRTYRYWYEDGLSESALGLIMLVLGLYQLILRSGRITPGTLSIMGFAFAPVVIGVVWLSGKALRTLKERFVYPRTGYVKYRREPARNKLFRILLAAVPVSAFTVYASLYRTGMNAVPAVVTIVLAGGLAYVTVKTGIMRFTAYGAFSIILALSLTAAGVDPERSVGLITTALGTVLIVSGLARFWLRFMRRRPSPHETGTEAGGPNPGSTLNSKPDPDRVPEQGGTRRDE